MQSEAEQVRLPGSEQLERLDRENMALTENLSAERAAHAQTRAALDEARALLVRSDEQADAMRSSYRDDHGPECCASTATVIADMWDMVTDRKSRAPTDTPKGGA